MGKRGLETINAYALGRALEEMWQTYDRFQRLGAERPDNTRGRG